MVAAGTSQMAAAHSGVYGFMNSSIAWKPVLQATPWSCRHSWPSAPISMPAAWYSPSRANSPMPRALNGLAAPAEASQTSGSRDWPSRR